MKDRPEHKDFYEEEKFLKDYLKIGKEMIDDATGKDTPEKDVKEVLRFLKEMGEIILDQIIDHEALKSKLEIEPKGFLMTPGKGDTCCICRCERSEVGRWYDKNGVKCLHCQQAIDEKQIPVQVARDKDSFYSDAELAKYFKLKGKVLTFWIAQKWIKARTIKNEKGGRHFRLFLMNDNKGFFPPKSLLEEAAGNTGQPWYEFVAPFDFLKDYHIVKYLVPAQPPRDVKIPESDKPQKPPQVEICNPCVLSFTNSKSGNKGT